MFNLMSYLSTITEEKTLEIRGVSLRKQSRSEREQSGRDGSDLSLLVEKLLVYDGGDVEERVSHSQEDSIEIRGRHG